MQTGYLQPSLFSRASRIDQEELSEEANRRWDLLKRFETATQGGLDSRKAANVVGAPRANLYRWKKAFRELGPRGLEPKSRQPKNLRQRRWDAAVVDAVEHLREEFPAWGKKKLCPLVMQTWTRSV